MRFLYTREDLDTFLQPLAQGAKLYLRPVGLLSGDIAEAAIADGAAVSLAGWKNRGFNALNLILRLPEPDPDKPGKVRHGYVSYDVLSLYTLLPEPVTAQLQALAAARHNHPPLNYGAPVLMGILNVTPDSFSDGGQFDDPLRAIEHGRAMLAAGAKVIDIGGESTRPGAMAVSAAEEAHRVVPIIETLAPEAQAHGALISVDTRHPTTMEEAIFAGAGMINDVTALRGTDPEQALSSLQVAAAAGCPVVLMHMRGEPQTMQDEPRYDHVLLDVYDFLEQRIAACVQAGIARHNIIVDPGIGFGKSVVHNAAIMGGQTLFAALGCPVLMGLSRKSFIGHMANGEPADSRLPGTIAANTHALIHGAHILRIHDVPDAHQMMKVVEGLQDCF